MRTITSHDPLQFGYKYRVSDGLSYHPDFNPDFTPAQCIALGIFGGAYFRDYPQFVREFPHLKHTIFPAESAENNYFGVTASMSRREWQKRSWMHDDDPRGWFQWYCRYDYGRRHDDDERQIKRWVNFKDRKMRSTLTDKTRQGLLHWGIKTW